MWEIVAGIDGIGEACRALDFPVIGGNCSLYNETNGEGILPSPAIGGVGLMADVNRMATIAFKRQGDAIIVIGETTGHLGQSIYLREIEDREEGACPPVDLASEKKNGDFVRQLIESGRVDTAHDVSDGGLLVALAEMALAGNIGLQVGIAGETTENVPFFFGEDQARYVLALPAEHTQDILDEARDNGIFVTALGKTHPEKTLHITGEGQVPLSDLRDRYEGWFPNYMASEEVPVTN
jgi:phosphoribosylformylglycinamidine synthase